MPSDDGALTEAHITSDMTPGQIAEEVIRVVTGPGYFDGEIGDGRAGVIGWLLRTYSKAPPEAATEDEAREHLEFLAELARYVSDLSRISAGTRDEVLQHLAWFADIASPAVRQLGKMQLAARDQWGFGWGTIASAVGVPRSTVRGQIETARRYYATFGTWFDQDGEHKGTAEEAAAALRAAPTPAGAD
jgi:hypothetical protein